MDKNNFSKEYKDLINSSGLTLEELLGVAASQIVECAYCTIRYECNELMLNEDYSCRKIWAEHLMGVNNGEA